MTANRAYPAITDAILTFGMRNSVKTHAAGIEAASLHSKNLIILRAAHFQSGCAHDHGAPGVSVIQSHAAFCELLLFDSSTRLRELPLDVRATLRC